MVNTRKIRALMIEKNVSYADLAKLTGLSVVSIRHKIYNIRPMTLKEAQIFQITLGVADNEFSYVFLNKESRDATND